MSLPNPEPEYAEPPAVGLSMLKLLELYPRQVASIREEAMISLNSLIDDFFDHFSTLSTLDSDTPQAAELKSACSSMIEKLQYVDTLSQRLEQLEKGFNMFSDSLQEDADFLHSSVSDYDGKKLLTALLASSRMSQERQVFSDYLREHEIDIEFPDEP